MPFYEAGDHKVDHPPLFACREHKNFLRFRASFLDEMLKSLEDMVPGNLHEIAAPHVGGDTAAFRLPEHLIPPRVLIYNPGFLKGAQALPYTLVFVDKRFIGIPAAYLTADRFEGCSECPAAAAAAAPAPATKAPPVANRPSPTGSSVMKAPPAAANKNVTGSGVRQAVTPPTKRLGPPPSPTPAPGGPRPNAPPPPVRPKPAGPPPRPPQR